MVGDVYGGGVCVSVDFVLKVCDVGIEWDKSKMMCSDTVEEWYGGAVSVVLDNS